MDAEPVVICAITERDTLRMLLTEAMRTENEVVPTPGRADEPGSVILEKLKIKKWRMFEKDAAMISVYFQDQSIELYSTGEAIGGEWKVGRGTHITLPQDSDIDKVVDLVVNDLIGDPAAEPKSGGLMLLPPPAEQ